MYYYGYFRNTDTTVDANGKLYKVIIITDFNNNGFRTVAGEELELSGNPFIVEYSSADNNIFKPYKCSTATISFYQNNINKDFYSTSGNDVYIALLSKKDNVVFDRETETPYNDRDRYNVEWVGYATPNAYNQSFESDKDLFQLECQDALSTLQYFNFKATKSVVTVTTLYEIIKGIVATTGAYKDIYISDSIKVPTQDIKNALSYIYVNEQNFFNEDGEPLKMLEVLEKILQYLGLTAVAKGNKLYILDYNAIASGYKEYHHIRHIRDNMFIWVENGYRSWEYWQEKGTAILEDNVEITKEDFSANGTNYSLSNVYNKVKVTDDFYFTDSINYYNKDLYIKPNIYSTTSSSSYSSIIKSDKEYTLVEFTNTFNNKKYNYYVNYYGCNSAKVKSYWYSQSYLTDRWEYDTADSVNTNKDWNYTNLFNNIGTCYSEWFITDKTSIIDMPQTEKGFLFSQYDPQFLNSQNAYADTYYKLEKDRQQKMLEITLENQILDKDDYILLNGAVAFFINDTLIPYYNSEQTTYTITNKAIWCSLECCGKYWNGEEWQTDNTLFELPLDTDEQSNAFNVDFSFAKNVGMLQGISNSAYGVKVPVDKISFSDVKLTFYRMWGLHRDSIPRVAVLKDLDFYIQTASNKDLFVNSDNANNTEYTNTIVDSALEEFEDITLDITTYDGKDKDYSSTFCDDSFTEYNYGAEELDRLSYTHNIITGELITPEEHLISNICRQYQKPNICLELSLNGSYYPYSVFTYHFFKDSVFIVDSISTDYANNSSTLKLCEKLFPKVVSTYGKRNKKREYQRNGEIIINDSHIKKDNEVIEHKYNKYDVPIISPHASGNIYITQYPNSTGEMQPYLYTWFNVENNEIIAYTPNVAKPVTGEINNNGELIIKI